MARCFHCKKELDTSVGPGRGAGCPSCGSDIKVCLNCRFYDRSAYNECRETSAERVTEKERSNFCEFFEFNGSKEEGEKEDPLKRLKDLFKADSKD